MWKNDWYDWQVFIQLDQFLDFFFKFEHFPCKY